MTEGQPIIIWAQYNVTNLKAIYEPSTQNQLSNQHSISLVNKWSLNKKVYEDITRR